MQVQSVISTLPDELWHAIFMCGVNFEVAERGMSMFMTRANCTSRTDRTPWVYGQVCRRWRAVALAYGSLWVHLRVLIPEVSPTSHRRLEPIRARLKRSGEHMLNLAVTDLAGTPDPVMWSVLFESEHRWQHLKLVSVRLALSPIPSHVASWTALISLDLDFRVSISMSYPQVWDLTSLSTLKSYTERSSRPTRVAILLPLETIESVAIYMYEGSVHCRLGFAPQLRSLFVSDDSLKSITLNKFHLESFTDEPVLFPNLEELHVTNAECLLFFARHIPLCRLFVYITTRPWPQPPQILSTRHLTEALTKSAGTLTSLDLRGQIPWDEDTFRASFPSMPLLQSLRLGTSFRHIVFFVLLDGTELGKTLRHNFMEQVIPSNFPALTDFAILCRVIGAVTRDHALYRNIDKTAFADQLLEAFKQVSCARKALEVEFDLSTYRRMRRTYTVNESGQFAEEPLTYY